MKKLLLFLMLFPLVSFSQNDIQKRASQIIITNNKSGEENFAYVTQYLIDDAIDIANRDKELRIIKTEVFKRGKLHPIALTILCADGSIRITGKFKSGIELDFGGVLATDDFEQVVNRGMKGSIYNKSFVAMDEIAHALGDQLTYK